jgi:hypothetical protein
MTINNFQINKIIPHDDLFCVIDPRGNILGDMCFQDAWSLIIGRLWKGGAR